MIITIDTEAKGQYSIDVVLFLLSVALNHRINKNTIRVVNDNYLAYSNMNNETILTKNGQNLIDELLLNSKKEVKESKINNFDELAKKLRELYPKGKKPGTSYMWRDSHIVIANRLKKLVAKYELDNNPNFTEENVIEATKRYINSFNGDYTYMQLLKYFILKKDVVKDIEVSQLLSFLENEDADAPNNSWMDNVRYDESSAENPDNWELSIDTENALRKSYKSL